MQCRGVRRGPVVALIIDNKSLPNYRLHFLGMALSALFWAFGWHAAAARAFRLVYIWADCLKSVYGVLTLLFFLRFILIKIM